MVEANTNFKVSDRESTEKFLTEHGIPFKVSDSFVFMYNRQ
jgi:hypothetical protein